MGKKSHHFKVLESFENSSFSALLQQILDIIKILGYIRTVTWLFQKLHSILSKLQTKKESLVIKYIDNPEVLYQPAGGKTLAMYIGWEDIKRSASYSQPTIEDLLKYAETRPWGDAETHTLSMREFASVLLFYGMFPPMLFAGLSLLISYLLCFP